MGIAKNAGRLIAALLLVQMVGGPVVNFALMGPVLAAPGFLENAAAHSLQASLAALIGLALGAVMVGIAITAWPVFRQYSQAMALWFVALAVAGFATTAVESATVLSMLSLSQAYATADVADAGLFEAMGAMVRSARKWAHYINLIVMGGAVFVLYGTLYRFALVPRALAALGLAGAMLQIIAVTMPLFGHRMVFLLLLPLGLSHLTLAVWLLAKGFAERRPLAPAFNE